MRFVTSHVAPATMSRAPLRPATGVAALSRPRKGNNNNNASLLTMSTLTSTSTSASRLSSSSARAPSSRRSALPPGWSEAFGTNDDDDDEDDEYVYEKVTLLTAEGYVVLPGRRVRRDRSDESPRARWRREAEQRRRREAKAEAAAERNKRASSPAPPPPRGRTAAERAAIRALQETLPGTRAPFSERNNNGITDENDENENENENDDSSPLLVFASPFAVSAFNSVDRGRVVRLDGYTRCPDTLGAAVELAARSLRGGRVVGGVRRRPAFPPPLPGAGRGSRRSDAAASTGLLELSVELPALYGCPPALDRFVAALGRAASDERLVIERIVKSWHFSR